MKKEQRNIGVMSVPISQAGLIPRRNLIDILHPLSKEIHLVAGGPGYSYFARQGNIHVHRVEHKTTRALFTRTINYVWTQLKISWKLIQLRRNVDLWIFFGGDTAALPIIIAKFLKKCIVIATTRSQAKVAQSQRDPLTAALTFLQGITYGLSNRIILYSPNLIKEWNLEKYCHKISIASENFLDFDKFKIKKPLNERDSLVGYIGRWSQEKGILNFMEAIPMIIETRDETAFLIGGDGQLRSQVEGYATKVSNSVKFPGWIPHGELPHYLNELKLLVIPSYTEAGPYIIFEAMACGTPALATAVGSIPDMVNDGETGFIMESNSPECIARNVIRALNHTDLEQISRNARALVQKEFTFEAAVEKYRVILDSLAAGTDWR